MSSPTPTTESELDELMVKYGVNYFKRSIRNEILTLIEKEKLKAQIKLLESLNKIPDRYPMRMHVMKHLAELKKQLGEL